MITVIVGIIYLANVTTEYGCILTDVALADSGLGSVKTAVDSQLFEKFETDRPVIALCRFVCPFCNPYFVTFVRIGKGIIEIIEGPCP